MKRVIVLLFLLQFVFVPVETHLDTQPEMMVTVQDIKLRSLEKPASQMGTISKGSILKVYCLDNVCFLDDGTTFILREYLRPFEWIKPLNYEI